MTLPAITVLEGYAYASPIRYGIILSRPGCTRPLFFVQPEMSDFVCMADSFHRREPDCPGSTTP